MNSSTPKLRRVVRFDNIPLAQTYFTEEGYLMDHPIVTTCGIFEYLNDDGTVRKELRIPEEVFSEKSLATYKGKPIIITHDAGVVNKDNVDREHIGTILSKGYRDGDSVRAEIVIHDTDKMKNSGLRELSLGYELTLDETPGEYNGEHYDAVQRNIEINHLALVSSARAGETARLNIDGKDTPNTEGGNEEMAKQRHDSDLKKPDAFTKAVEDFNANSATAEEPVEETPVVDEDNTPMVPAKEETVDPVQMVKDRRDRRDSEGDPTDVETAMGVIAQQDEDIDTLIEVIEAMKAKNDFDAADDELKEDEEEETNCDEEEEVVENEDSDEGKSENLNMDSIDRIVSKKLELCRIGDKLHLDGIERMPMMEAKKAIIKKVRPSVRLDGKSNAYINAMFDITKDAIAERKDTDYQRSQMFNTDSRNAVANRTVSGAAQAREKMISRMKGDN